MWLCDVLRAERGALSRVCAIPDGGIYFATRAICLLLRYAAAWRHFPCLQGNVASRNYMNVFK